MRTWAGLVAGTVALVGMGIFLIAQGSGGASEYASIASFFLAIPMAAASIVSLVDARSKSRAEGEGGRTERRSHRAGKTNSFIRRSGVVQTGEHAVANVNIGTSSDTRPQRPKAPKRRQHNR